MRNEQNLWFKVYHTINVRAHICKINISISCICQVVLCLQMSPCHTSVSCPMIYLHQLKVISFLSSICNRHLAQTLTSFLTLHPALPPSLSTSVLSRSNQIGSYLRQCSLSAPCVSVGVCGCVCVCVSVCECVWVCVSVCSHIHLYIKKAASVCQLCIC